MIFQVFPSATVPNMVPHGTLHKAINPDFMGTTAIPGAAAEPVSTQETQNWLAFSIGGTTDATAAIAGKGWQKGEKYCDAAATRLRFR
jgi:hypothetical protein